MLQDVRDRFVCPAYREGRISQSELARWARSEDRFRRRAALACTVALNTKARGGHGDAPRTLAICDMLLSDRDDLVVKAMSWALRELAARCPYETVHYRDQHETELARRVVREVRNKLTTGKRSGRTGRNARSASRA
jgi:3-methyladenine DNA glycosylase AlkD